MKLTCGILMAAHMKTRPVYVMSRIEHDMLLQSARGTSNNSLQAKQVYWHCCPVLPEELCRNCRASRLLFRSV